VNLLDVADQDNDLEINIIPNPANNEFKIIATNDLIKSVKVFDLLGVSIFSDENLNLSVFNFNSSNFQSGVFYLTIRTEKKFIVKKLLINH
jgi:uridylate kinase